jgi:hypothetical protein
MNCLFSHTIDDEHDELYCYAGVYLGTHIS